MAWCGKKILITNKSILEKNNVQSWDVKYHSNLLLKRKDVWNTTINRILKPGLCLIRYCHGSLWPISHWKVGQQFRHITRPEHFMYSSKVRRSLLMAEIWREHTSSHTFSSQKFACTTWRSRSCHFFFARDLVLVLLNPYFEFPCGSVKLRVELFLVLL
jgi:hypothetical protein